MTDNTMNMTAANTATPVPVDFELPTLVECDFSSDEPAEDMDSLTMSLPRVKIPAGGALQFEIPTGDLQNPDYARSLVGVILYNHASNAYWPEGKELDDNELPLCPPPAAFAHRRLPAWALPAQPCRIPAGKRVDVAVGDYAVAAHVGRYGFRHSRWKF